MPTTQEMMPTTQAAKPESSKGAPHLTAPPIDVPQVSAPPQTSTNDTEKREALVRSAAYSLYERRGCVSGCELEDWLQAEVEVNRQLVAAQEPEPTTCSL